MNGRAAVALVSLCALALCAFAAPSAVAKGTTAFTCVKGGGAQDFSDAQCTKGVKAGTGEYGHVAIEEASKTEINLSGENTVGHPKFEGTIEKQALEILCLGETTGLAPMTNEFGPPMFVEVGQTSIKFEGCVPVGVFATEECKVTNERIEFTTTLGKTVANTAEFEFKPESKVLTFIQLEKCKNTKLNGSRNTEGSMRAIYTGAFLNFSPETTKGLVLAGQQASLRGSLTTHIAGGNAVSFTQTAN
jgi:hypothetical protein